MRRIDMLSSGAERASRRRRKRGSRCHLVLASLFLAGSSAKADEVNPFSYLSELRGGLLRHDAGIFSKSMEGAWDANLEVLFTSPTILGTLGSPRPHLGTSIDFDGKTSQIYAGLTWDWDLTNKFFVELSAGGAFHNGNLDKSDPRRKDLGSHLEFRESASIGYKVTANSRVLLTLDHISNAGLASYNGGMENFGIRYGYRF